MSSQQSISARFAAIDTLRRLKKERIPLTQIFDKLLANRTIQAKDRQLANNIIHGVLRNQQSLERMLQQLCTIPLRKLHPFVLQALHVGLYQIMFLDRIPDSAAVNESVNAAKTARLPKRLHGFINGVLRNAVRKQNELMQFCQNEKEPLLNHPDWLVKRWSKQFGKERAIAICLHNNKQAPLVIQCNHGQISREALLKQFTTHGFSATYSTFGDTGIEIMNYHGPITALPGFTEGLFHVQDQGAQLLCELIKPVLPGGKYLDACAGVGGKSSILLQLLQKSKSQLFAVEPHPGRQKKFKQNMTRVHPGVTIPLFQGTLQQFAAQTDKQFHGIFMDVPCSGTGVCGRHPDIRWNRRESDLQQFQEKQLALLECAAPLLRPKGALVYATCSLEHIENERVIEQFLTKHSDFYLEDCANCFANIKDEVGLDSVSGQTKAMPHPHTFIDSGFFVSTPQPGIDGFFGARLRKT